jgi:glutamine amidotransferase
VATTRRAGPGAGPGSGPDTVVIDYGAGNLHSIARALAHVGCAVRVESDPASALGAELLVLPGQGRFGQVARAFRASGFEPLVRDHIAADRPFLGICVGLQLLLENSEEDPAEPGLGIVSGRVRRFADDVAVPQMGWNELVAVGEGPLLKGVPAGAYAYFANSYYAAPELDAPGSVTTYGSTRFLSSFSLGNLHATQFHPEKSQDVGLKILANVRDATRSTVTA